ncbi:transcription elongation factor B polypeptide 3 isoform X2 [Drosophila subobscura]|uniref:transcription elongation factor B polypeptide 3 isoform X2 n=1 Tax=Drosophila subobscura TaxID=7241 RepID=UPI00155B2691|nr:transcription elongation factor B polypeptide 3 isoform X2 [Drosophila subobscura]
MTSTNNLVDVVRHYQRSIERHGEDEKRLMHCITKLFNLPIKFEHLQETGIGKTVNALRKLNGEVGVAARTLVTRWKAMVAAEEEPAEPTPSATANTSHEEDSGKSNGRRSSEDDKEQEYKGSNSSSGDDAHSSSKRKSRHDESSSKSKSERSSSSKHHSKSSKSESDKKHKSSRHDRSRDKDKEKDKERESHKESKQHRDEKSNGEHKTKDSSSSNKSRSSSSSHRNSTSTSHHSSKSESHKNEKEHRESKHEKSLKEDKEKPKHIDQKTPKGKSDRHKSSSSSSKSSKRHHSPQRQEEEFATPKPKIAKTKTTKDITGQEESVDGFDSSMGANFDDVLGMLNMPMSSSKKSSFKAKHVAKPHTTAASTSSTSSAAAAAAAVAPSYREASSSSSRPVTTKKPELLASTAKLEPLDPSIALELPTISNNYKPLPLNQTVMDVVFNHGGGSHKPSAARYFNESEALAAGISSKTMRTKIYSGVRTGQILQVASLFDLCTRVLQKNIDALEYTGGVPFEVLRPVLERATPQQLLNFEEYNPYLMEDSDILWQMHVTRNCRSQRREEMETWREMFLRCQEEKDRKLSILAESIRASQKISEAPVRKTQLAFVDSMVKPPRNVQRKQEQYGTRGKLIATPAARVAALSSVTPNAAKVGDARLRVLGAGRDTAQMAPMRPKKAPLMAKTLQFMRGRHKR